MGVTALGLMTYSTHDVGSMALFINGVAHCLAVDCKTFILFAIRFIPFLKGAVQMSWIDTDKDIPDDVFAWNYALAVFHTAPETFPRLLAKAVCPVRDSLIASHPAQNRASGNGEHG